MENNTQIQTTTTQLPEQVSNMQKLPQLLEKYIPKLEKFKKRALSVLDPLVEPTNDEEMESAIGVLAAVRDVYNANLAMRKEMTEITDAFKDMVMEYERDFDPKSPKSKYSEKLKLINNYQQKKADKAREEQIAAAKRKEAENLKVDIRTHIMNNLATMLATGVQKADAGSKDFFDKTSLEEFDKRAESYKGMKPKLKMEDYELCFIPNDTLTASARNLLKSDELRELVNELQQTETYAKWNDALLEKVSPIINDWRARIPEIKKAKQEMADAQKKSAEEAEQLRLKQQEEENQRQKERQAQIERDAEELKKKNEQAASLDKMSNNFAEQGALQSIADAGGRKKIVVKFNDNAKAPKAFLEIVYQCMAHPDFIAAYPVFQKRDKSKKLMVDDKNRPVYIDAVQFWLDWWADNCNGVIQGIELSEDSKVTVRK